MEDNNNLNLGNIFNQLIKENKLKPKLLEAKLKDSWPEVMGKMIDKYTVDISLKKRVLFLRITSAPLKNELVMSKKKMIDLLNNFLGEEFIRDIVIR